MQPSPNELASLVLAQSAAAGGPTLPPLGDVLVVVIGAVLSGMLFLGAIFTIMATAAERRLAHRAALIVGPLNVLPVGFWIYLGLRFEGLFVLFAAVQLGLAGLTIVTGLRARPQTTTPVHQQPLK